MSAQTPVTVQKVYKHFILPNEKKDSMKRAFTEIFKPKHEGETVQHALHDISFEVRQGEFFGIVGRNGSGKSTLLRMLAGIYQPTHGHITISGKLVPFIELGVGFNPELTGRENVYLNGALLGFAKKEVDARYDQIVAFAELERFMDQKLKNYSSGMQVRLAFSVAIMAEADILLVDEVLAVGDAAFQRKCFDYFHLLKKNKKTVIFVTHDMSAVREYCDRAMLIEKSRLVDIGAPARIAAEYAQLFNERSADQKGSKNSKRWGDKKMEITKVTATPDLLIENDQPLKIVMDVQVNADMEDPVFGFLVKNPDGHAVLGTNSKIKQKSLGDVKKGDKIRVEWELLNVFSDGIYSIDLAAQHRDTITQCDWWEDAASFEVVNKERVAYPMNPPISLALEKK